MIVHETMFAPGERASPDKIKQQQDVLHSLSFLEELINNVTSVAIILNKELQIVYFNKALLELFNIKNPQELVGKRTGEAMNCKYKDKSTGGCGTAENCRVCLIVNSILKSQRELSKVVNETRFTQSRDGVESSFDLSISASSIEVSGEVFTFLNLSDISDTKRREAFDKIFYHDVLNIAGGIKGLAELALLQKDYRDIQSLISVILDSTHSLMEEIMSQRDLSLAENNEFILKISNTPVLSFLEPLVQLYQSHDLARNKKLVLGDIPQTLSIKTDPRLLKRILGNLIKNAMEASDKNQIIDINCVPSGEFIEFHIHNHRFIPRDVQLQIFQRSFSTKGSNRGLGTYSVKLLTERYLKGRVSFETDEEKGSTFTVVLPLDFD